MAKSEIKNIPEYSISDTIAGYGFLLPAIITMIIFVFWPVISAFLLSFTDWSALCPDKSRFVGLDNYIALLHDEEFYTALYNTAIYTFWVVPVQTFIALILAVVLNQKLMARNFFRAAFFFPSISSSVVITMIFMWIFNASGVFNALLSWAGAHGADWLGDPKYALKAIMVLNIWTTIGTLMVIFLAALQGVPAQIYEAAAMDGAGPVRIFFKIIMPLMRPIIFFVLILGIIGCFQMFDQAFVASGGGGGPVNSTLTAVFFIYLAGFKYFEMGYACAAAFILFAVIFSITIIQRKIMPDEGQ